MPSIGLLQTIALLVAATVLEVSGDATIRIALYNHVGASTFRLALFAVGAALVFGYGTFLNLAPLEFRQVVGLYIAILFVVWQIINFVFFKSLPSPHILLGGILIISGGLLVSFWR